MRKKVPISDLILLSLEKTVDGYVRFDDFIHNHYRYKYGVPDLKKSALSVAFKRLREQGYLDLEKYNDTLILKLTDKGRSEAIVRKILNNEEWDGKWRIAVFDIPEKHRKVRNILRGRLKMWGFKQWQKSVWASKKDVTEVLRQFVKEIGVEKWVMIMESENVGSLHFSVDQKPQRTPPSFMAGVNAAGTKLVG